MIRVFLGADNISSPLGFTTAENFQALTEGKTALALRKFPFSNEQFFCSVIDDYALKNAFPFKEQINDFTKLEQMCLISIADVLDRSKVDLSDKKNLLIISTTKGNIDVLEGSSSVKENNREYLSS